MTYYNRFTTVVGILFFANMHAASLPLQIIDDACSSSSSSSSSSPLSARPPFALSALCTDTTITICGQSLASPNIFPPTFHSLSPMSARPLSISPEPVIDTSLCRHSAHCTSPHVATPSSQDEAAEHRNNLRPYQHAIYASKSPWRENVTTIMSEPEDFTRKLEIGAHIIYFIHRLNQRDFTTTRVKIYDDACKEWLEVIKKKHTQSNPPTDPSSNESYYWQRSLDELRPYVKENKRSIIMPSHR